MAPAFKRAPFILSEILLYVFIDVQRKVNMPLNRKYRSGDAESNYLFTATFSADDAHIYADISQKAIEVFKKKIPSRAWTVCSNGLIKNVLIEGLRRINFHLDLTDARTRRNFNMLPQLLSGNAAQAEIEAGFLLQVIYVMSHHEEEEQQSERIVSRDGELFLSGHLNAWISSIDNFAALMSEVAEIELTE